MEFVSQEASPSVARRVCVDGYGKLTDTRLDHCLSLQYKENLNYDFAEIRVISQS